MRKIYYEKKGRRYVPVSEEFRGFPASGVWIVSQGFMGPKGKDWNGYWIMRLGDTPSVMTAAAFARHEDAVGNAIVKAMKEPRWSPASLARAVIQRVATEEDLL